MQDAQFLHVLGHEYFHSGSILLAHLGAVDSILPQVEGGRLVPRNILSTRVGCTGLLQAWNSKSERPEARTSALPEAVAFKLVLRTERALFCSAS